MLDKYPLQYSPHVVSGATIRQHDLGSEVVDTKDTAAYLFGGVLTNSSEATSHLYRLKRHNGKLQFEDLTEQVRPNTRHALPMRLPGRISAGTAIMHHAQHSYLLIFGGKARSHETSLYKAQYSLICVRLTDLVWRTIVPEGNVLPLPRCKPACTVVGLKLYIFGGYSPVVENSVDRAEVTYSALRLRFDAGKAWAAAWIDVATPLPPGLGKFGHDLAAVTVNEEEGIMLILRGERVGESISHGSFGDIFITTKSFILFRINAAVDPFTILRTPTEYMQCLPLNGFQWFQMYPLMHEPRSVIFSGHFLRERDLCPDLWKFKWKGKPTLYRIGVEDVVWETNLDLQSFSQLGTRSVYIGYDSENQMLHPAAANGDYLEKPAEPTMNAIIEFREI